MRKWQTRALGVLCVVAVATVALVATPTDRRRVRAEDRNGDGRPDAWRLYDAAGHLIKLALDSNFDGRSDVEEYYTPQGALFRRESDRNFNGQVDLVEDFDPATHERERSIADVDDDGTADLLVLFRNGVPVFSKQTARTPSAVDPGGRVHRRHDVSVGDDAASPLIALNDPFSADRTVRAAVMLGQSSGAVGLSTSGGLPSPVAESTAPADLAGGLSLASSTFHDSTPPAAPAPRGPPSF